MTDIAIIVANKIKRDALKAGMLPAAVQDFVDTVAPLYALNDNGKVRSTKTGQSPKKAIAAAITSRPEIFAPGAAANVEKKDTPFDPNMAQADKKSLNPYKWPSDTPALAEKRLAAIAKVMQRMNTKFVNGLAKAGGCSVSGAKLATKD